ncbi:MAG TPA: Mpo1-like protein [Bradyrhizobium sp.]|nr:Mpo1-like protein [Bradyrhizobium sp.]
MNAFLKRQLTDYVEYHRDPWNCAMHVFGIVALFFAAILPLSLSPVHLLGAPMTLAPLMVLPVLLYWLLLDAALGAALFGFAVMLLWAAAQLVSHTSTALVWSITAVLIIVGIAFQAVGHRVFERRQPALVDNPSHLLLGPIFVTAKLFIAFGLRRDLAAIIRTVPPPAPRGPSPSVKEHQGEPLPHS